MATFLTLPGGVLSTAPEGVDVSQPGVRASSGLETQGGFGLTSALKTANDQGWTLSYSSETGKTVFSLKLVQ